MILIILNTTSRRRVTSRPTDREITRSRRALRTHQWAPLVPSAMVLMPQLQVLLRTFVFVCSHVAMVSC